MDAVMLRYLLAALLITAMPASAESLDCRVIGIADGNTFSCRTNVGERLRVRLAEIDAPELKQPYGSQARQALSDHIFGKNVTLAVRAAMALGGPWRESALAISTSIRKWSGRAPPGRIALAWTTAGCSTWRLSPESSGAACGRCTRPNSNHHGNGASRCAKVADPTRTLSSAQPSPAGNGWNDQNRRKTDKA